METLETKLINQSETFNLDQAIDLFKKADKDETNVEDVILNDQELLKQLAELWRSSEPALRTLVSVINADLIRYMVQKATPVETVGIRHELQGTEKILTRLAKYHAVFERTEKKEQADKEAEEENPTESPPVEAGEEGAL